MLSPGPTGGANAEHTRRARCGPARISDALRESFERAGYPLRTDRLALPGVIEVYPHPALVELAGALERLPYKTSKVRSYWPLATPPEPRTLLYRQWSEIVALLAGEIANVGATLPQLELNALGSEGVRGFARRHRLCLGCNLCSGRTGQAVRRSEFGDMDFERYYGDQGMTANSAEDNLEVITIINDLKGEGVGEFVTESFLLGHSR